LNKSANFYGWKIIAKKINENFRTDIFWNFTKIHLCKHNNNKNWRVKLVSRYFFVVRIKNDFITSSFRRFFFTDLFWFFFVHPKMKMRLKMPTILVSVVCTFFSWIFDDWFQIPIRAWLLQNGLPAFTKKPLPSRFFLHKVQLKHWLW